MQVKSVMSINADVRMSSVRPTLINVPSTLLIIKSFRSINSRFPAFPGAISNSKRFPEFPGVADTLNFYTQGHPLTITKTRLPTIEVGPIALPPFLTN